MLSSDAFRTNLRALRDRRGMSQGAMADAIQLDRAAYNKLEAGTRRITLDDAVACAAVLDAPFVALVFNGDDTLTLAPGTTASPDIARQWACGQKALEDDQDAQDAYFDAAGPVSANTRETRIMWHLLDLVSQLGAAAADDDPSEMGDVLKELERELDRQRDAVAARKRKKARADRKGQR